MADIRAIWAVLAARRSELEFSDNEWEQLEVYLEAFKLFMEREARYHSLWKQYGAADSFQHMRSKLARSQFLLEGFTDDQDDPLDLINYVAFFLRNLRAGRIKGTTLGPLDQLKLLGLELVVDQETPPGEVRIMDGNECVGSVLLG